MNAVEFLTNHRVVVNRHARGAPVPHLTESAVKATLDELNKGIPYTSIQWRGRGGGHPTSSGIEFDRQLDKISIWVEQWSHSERCRFLEELLRQSSYTQIQLLHTVLQPSLHRDFMYTVRSRFPEIEFTPVSTHITRELKDKLGRLRLDNFYRVRSAYVQKDDDMESLRLPLLQEQNKSAQSLPQALVSWTSTDRLSCRKEVQENQFAKEDDRERWISDGKDETEKTVSQDAVSRFVEMPVRRHIQDEYVVQKVKQSRSNSFRSKTTRSTPTSIGPQRSQLRHKLTFVLDEASSRPLTYRTGTLTDRYTDRSTTDMGTTRGLSMEAYQILVWYTHEWNDTKRNEFLHKLLLKLDPRQHYFISSFLSIKQHKDIVGLLPEHLALKILKYLTPKELLAASRVSKTWSRLANDNSLWRSKCGEVKLEVPIPHKPDWKNVYKDNLYLRTNWNKGLCRTMDLRGHTHCVLCVTCDKTRLASGSQDRTIRVWDLNTGLLLHTLKGHTKGVWCLQFFTKHLLISGSYDSTIRVWNLRTGLTTRTLLGHSSQVWCLKRYKGLIVSGSQDRTAKIWDIGRCLLLRTLIGHNAAVFSADWSEDGQLVITGSADRSVRIWEADTGIVKKVVWVSPTTSIMTVSYSHGYFACAYDGSVCLYRGSKLVKVFTEHRKRVESVDLRITDPEKGLGYIISAGKDGFIKYWDTSKDESVQTFEGHNQPVNCVYVDELRIASASYDYKIRVWDFNVGMPPKECSDSEDEDYREETKSGAA